MSRLAWFRSPAFHRSMCFVWAAMAVPALLWWKDSVLFVILLSLYANFIGHWSAMQGARAERATNGEAEG